MSNQQIENPETRLVVATKRPVSKGCLIALIIAILICATSVLPPKLTTVMNQIKWHTSGITKYSISIFPIGYTTWPDSLGSLIIYSGKEAPKTTVDDLFGLAYECFIFCSVQYDPQYGYPTQISKGFIEGGSLEITVEPSTP